MSEFSFSATAECEYCGAYLESSSADCDHNGVPAKKHVFRQISATNSSITGVVATPKYKWQKLQEKVGDDWIEYEYLGPKHTVNSLLGTKGYTSVDDVPRISMSTDANI
jgi:hypothetical protein